eukprot:jgi/Bigna1/139353/aug1.50_g14061
MEKSVSFDVMFGLHLDDNNTLKTLTPKKVPLTLASHLIQNGIPSYARFAKAQGSAVRSRGSILNRNSIQVPRNTSLTKAIREHLQTVAAVKNLATKERRVDGE